MSAEVSISVEAVAVVVAAQLGGKGAGHVVRVVHMFVPRQLPRRQLQLPLTPCLQSQPQRDFSEVRMSTSSMVAHPQSQALGCKWWPAHCQVQGTQRFWIEATSHA